MKTIKQLYIESLNEMTPEKAYGISVSAPNFVCNCGFEYSWRAVRNQIGEKHRKQCKQPWKLISMNEIICSGNN